MTIRFKSLRRNIGVVILVTVCVFVMSVTEAWLRTLASRPIPISVVDGTKADVRGQVQPDIFWMGSAWSVKIDSEQPVAVDFDGQWQADVPAGRHMIYSNHDSNNTTTFVPTSWQKTPTLVTVTRR